MDHRVIQVPVSLLLDSDLTASAKVVWMALGLRPTVGPAELESATGLARNTILRAMHDVKGYRLARRGRPVRVPAALIADPTVGARAKVLFGLLQTTPDFRGGHGRFTYPSLSSRTHLSPNTLKHGIADLVGAGWVQTAQASRISPIHFTLGSPEQRRAEATAAQARRRMKRARFGGEAIMQEYLSLLIDSDQFTDNARPGFLVNPLTGERLELDRFYPPNLAFEFHGAQHYGATDRCTQAESEAQHLRDLMKAGICLYRGIQLVLIHPDHLSLQGMKGRIGQIMPLRNLEGQEVLIDLLEEESIKYRANAVAERTQPRGTGSKHS